MLSLTTLEGILMVPAALYTIPITFLIPQQDRNQFDRCIEYVWYYGAALTLIDAMWLNIIRQFI